MTAKLQAPSADFIAAVKEIVGPAGWRAPQDAPGFFVEPRGKMRGRAALVARPDAVEQVSRIVAMAQQARVALVPHGGGTGLVGGQVRPDGPEALVLSLERMNKVRFVDVQAAAMCVEAGCVLAQAQSLAAEAGGLFPLTYGSAGTAQIGGALAVNSGGVAVLRYGNARDLCLGVEAVLPDGSIHHGLKVLRKDNTGYDLRNLLIGSEGTLGVITAATLRLFPRPIEQAAAMVKVASPAAAVELLRKTQAALGEVVSGFELISGVGLGFLAEHLPQVRQPLGRAPAWSCLVELGAAGAHEGLLSVLEMAFEEGLVEDAVIAESETQRLEFWRAREEIPIANRLVGAVASHDVSAPISRLPDFITRGAEAIASINSKLRVNCFGHVGDGNLHYNAFPPAGEKRDNYMHLADQISRAVHDLAYSMGGSISAEHGVGRFKARQLPRYIDPAKLAAMHAIKNALDPAGIMNPGAIFPEGS